MSHPYLKKTALTGVGIVLSIPLVLLIEMLMKMKTPGWVLAHELLHGPDASIALVGFAAIGVDFLLCFAVLVGSYAVFAKLSNGRNNDPS
jgi:hypothetical protein